LGLLIVSPAFSQEKYPFYAAVVIDGVNVRTDSTINSEVIINLSKGDVVSVIKEFYDWYKIILPKNAVCYVFSRYISASSQNSGAINSENVNVRMAPNTKSAILGRLKKGTIVNITNFAGDWYTIEPTNETYGWIHKSVVKSAEDTNFIPQPATIKSTNTSATTAAIITAQNKKEEPKNTLEIEGTVSGQKKSLGLFKKQLSYKLTTADNKAYILTTNKYKLNDYINNKVRVKGRTVLGSSNPDYPTIEVEEITKLN